MKEKDLTGMKEESQTGMKAKYLPGTLSDRVCELRERNKMTQAELAQKIGISPSTLSRIENNETENTGTDILLKLAETFRVSTDFLLGITDYPDRKNYEVEVLGFTPEAVHRMASGAIDKETLNRLLTNRLFPAAARSVAAYINGTIEEGIGVQNEIMNLAIHGLKGYPEAQAAAMTAKIPQALVLERVMARFEAMLKDMKREVDNEKDKGRTSETTDIFEIVHGINEQVGDVRQNRKSITAEDITSAILSVTATANGMDASRLEAFREPIVQLLEQSGERSAISS